MTNERGRPNVLLLIFDTLRPDYLSCYGGPVETPGIDAVAKRGITFENAYAAGPGTAISHASLFTGQYPTHNGVADQVEIPEDVPTMASWFRDAGYETYGIAGPSRMSSNFGYERGFDRYLERYFEVPPHLSTDYLTEVILNDELRRPLVEEFVSTIFYGKDKYTRFRFRALQEKLAALSRPFFALANFPTVHAPYAPPRPYKTEATPELSRPKYEFIEHLTGREESLDKDDIRSDRVYEAQFFEGISQFLRDPDYLNEAELELLRTWYSASIRYLNDRFTWFDEFLQRNGVLDDTIVILMADHGEHIGEHGLLGHSYKLFEENLRVPLIISGPGIPAGERRSDFVSLVDIFDTVCDVAGLKPPDSTDGQSLFTGQQRSAAYAEDGIRPRPHTDGMEEHRRAEFTLGRKAVRTEEYLYVLRSDGTERMFDRPDEERIEDPDEDELERYREMVTEELSSDFVTVNGSTVDDDRLEENLRHLGYIE